MSGVVRPTLAEIRAWDREHRRECNERHCTLDHRMAEFFDWAVAIRSQLSEDARLLSLAIDPDRLNDYSPNVAAAYRRVVRWTA